MRYFYVTPYSLVLGNNHKTYTRVTPNRCARMCLEEETFVCRSFDYQVKCTNMNHIPLNQDAYFKKLLHKSVIVC